MATTYQPRRRAGRNTATKKRPSFLLFVQNPPTKLAQRLVNATADVRDRVYDLGYGMDGYTRDRLWDEHAMPFVNAARKEYEATYGVVVSVAMEQKAFAAVLGSLEAGAKRVNADRHLFLPKTPTRLNHHGGYHPPGDPLGYGPRVTRRKAPTKSRKTTPRRTKRH